MSTGMNRLSTLVVLLLMGACRSSENGVDGKDGDDVIIDHDVYRWQGGEYHVFRTGSQGSAQGVLHPAGDLIPCRHWTPFGPLHPVGDLIPCQHHE